MIIKALILTTLLTNDPAMIIAMPPDKIEANRKRGKKGDCSEGVYFYVCTINELKLNGFSSYNLKGTVSLIRGNTKKAD